MAQSADGRISCRDQLTGDLLWQGSCDQFQEDCSNSVRSDIGLSRSGQFLYFSDVKGRLISWKLGDIEEVLYPTPPPDWDNPLRPTNDVDWARDQGKEQSPEETSLGGTIALVLLAAMIAVGSTMYIVMINRRKRLPHPMQEPMPEDDEIDPSGPDPAAG